MSIFLIYNCAKFHTKILNDCQDIAILLRGAIFYAPCIYSTCIEYSHYKSMHIYYHIIDTKTLKRHGEL